MATKTKIPTPDPEDRCPNCGYCPHCGQSAKPQPINIPIYPQPIPVPYRRPIHWEEGARPWWGITTSREGVQEARSVSVSREEGAA